jgi:hypothetical protein
MPIINPPIVMPHPKKSSPINPKGKETNIHKERYHTVQKKLSDAFTFLKILCLLDKQKNKNNGTIMVYRTNSDMS